MNNYIPKTGKWVKVTKTVPIDNPVLPFSIMYAFPEKLVQFKGIDHISNEIYTTIPTDDPYTNSELTRFFGSMDSTAKWYLKFIQNKEIPDFPERVKDIFESFVSKGVEIEQQVRVLNEFGPAVLKPNEYVILDLEEVKEYMKEIIEMKQGELIYLNNGKSVKDTIKDQVFYLTSRGIPKAEALQMCIGQIKTANLFYMEFHPYFTAHFCNDARVIFTKRLKMYQKLDMKDRFVNFTEKLSAIGWGKEEISS